MIPTKPKPQSSTGRRVATGGRCLLRLVSLTRRISQDTRSGRPTSSCGAPGNIPVFLDYVSLIDLKLLNLDEPGPSLDKPRISPKALSRGEQVKHVIAPPPPQIAPPWYVKPGRTLTCCPGSGSASQLYASSSGWAGGSPNTRPAGSDLSPLPRLVGCGSKLNH